MPKGGSGGGRSGGGRSGGGGGSGRSGGSAARSGGSGGAARSGGAGAARSGGVSKGGVSKVSAAAAKSAPHSVSKSSSSWFTPTPIPQSVLANKGQTVYHLPAENYVGQTGRTSGVRYSEHARAGKDTTGAQTVTTFVGGRAPQHNVNCAEAYDIGLRDAFNSGGNMTRGNDATCYGKGYATGMELKK